MGYLSKDDILAADDIHYQDEYVPEWGGTVRVRGMNAKERGRVEATFVAVKGESVEIRTDAMQELRVRTVAACLIDENGDRLFDDQDVAELAQKASEPVHRLFDIAQRLSGTNQGATAAMAGNSPAAPSGNSDSA